MTPPPEQPFRLPAGGLIDRDEVLRFSFDGGEYEGHPGDTLASALLASGVRLVARSFKYHRPRGIVSDGVEEPSALVQLELGAFTEPNRRPTEIALYDGLRAFSQHAWPSLSADLGALIGRLGPLFPAGFYYKTFIAPRAAWAALWEPFLRHMAGLGDPPDEADPSRYDKRHAHCDVLVVGAGPAGLSAALAAGRSGARVILADRDAIFGGALLRRTYRIGDADATDWVGETLAELEAMPEVQVLPETTVAGHYDGNYLIAVERLGETLGPAAPPGMPRQRLWHIRARRVVLATGAIERPLVFPDNDRPGIMLAGAVESYLHRYAVMPGRRAVLYANNDNAYPVAAALAAAGIEVAAIVDPRGEPGAAAHHLVAGIPIYSAHRVVATAGWHSLRRIWVRPMPPPGARGAGGGRAVAIDCDLLAVSGGWNPAVHLFAQAQGRTRFDEALAAFVPASHDSPVECAGAANGAFALADCLVQGEAAGARAAAACGFAVADPAEPPATDDEAKPGAAPLVPAMTRRAGRRAFVDLHNDVTAADIALATREGYSAVEHLKRYTTLGMGTDQGKTGNIPGLALLSGLTGREIAAAGTTTFRPPFVPVSYGALAGREQGRLADPERVTPLHDWHVDAGAVFEPVGQWQRPRYYPQNGEDMAAAVHRECLTVRDGVALLDASTLGKFEVVGRDAARFLDRIYAQPMQGLAFGRCRYGLMCRDDGMVFDDGVVTRLAPDRFFLTTTTGNAAIVLDWFEEWLQTEWLDLDVFCTSVTEQWANLTLVGPRSREVLSLLSPRLPLDAMSLPFMRMREADIAGIPARIFRVSFCGELSYEINVPADLALGLWEVMMAAGARQGIAPYGTEAMHVLRAEKGFLIVGQETDGSVTPVDLGMAPPPEPHGSVPRDFLGRRAWARSDLARSDRKQLVGLLPEDPDVVLPEGAQLVDELGGIPPLPMVGHVTSSYLGPRLGRSFALALVKGGHARHGQTVWAPMPDRLIAARICPPNFYDPQNSRRNG